MKEGKKGIVLSALGTLFFSTSPILTRFASELPVAEIAFFRMIIGSFFILIAAKAAKVDLSVNKRELARFILYGLVTSFHFLFYIGSVLYTTIAHALSLVYTAPIMITVLVSFLLKEKIPRYKYIGIFLVILGIIILTGFEVKLTPQMVLGDIMALLSALALAIYSVIGRSERKNFPLLKYVFWVYFTCALFLLVWALPSFKIPSSWTSWLVLVLLGLMPTTLGHTLYNAGIRYIHPTYANLISTQEVTGGVILGALIFGEVPSISTIAGILVMFLGLSIVLLEKTTKNQWNCRRKNKKYVE